MIVFESVELLLLLQSLRLSNGPKELIEKIELELHNRQESTDFENRKREIKEHICQTFKEKSDAKR